MAQPPAKYVTEKTFPAPFAASITPSDVTTFLPTRGLYVGGAGNVVVTMAGDSAAQTFTAVPAGTILPISVTQVTSGTDATSIVALW